MSKFIWNDFVGLYQQLWYQHPLKKIKLLNFCVAILILKMKGEKAMFSVYYALLLHEREKHSWNKKICAVYEEGAWLIKCIRSGLQSFVLKISHQMMRWWGRPVEVDGNQIETNWEQSTLYYVGESWHTQNVQIKCWKLFSPAWLC